MHNIRLTRRGRTLLACIAVLPLAFLASLDADAMPAPIGATTVQKPVQNEREWRCKDKAARYLHEAGFTGYAHKQAWAILYRESRHQNLVPGHPQFNGSDWGVWQVNKPTWGGEKWWSDAAMSEPAKQSRIVYRILTKKGTYWRPWGLTADGQLDTTHYGQWGEWEWENWIMAPFRTGLSLYPCKTTPPAKGER